MDRIYASGAAGSAPSVPASPSSGYPTAGNPGTGTPATKPGPYWYHMMMEELMSIISAAGITPAPGTLNQVLQALRSAGVFQTPAQFDNTTKAATTAFVQRALGSMRDSVGLTANTTMDDSHIGKLVIALTSGMSLTFPTASGRLGQAIAVLNQTSGNVTINAGNINSAYGSSTTSITMPPYSSGVFVCDGTSWDAIGGSAAYGTPPLPTSSAGVGQWVGVQGVGSYTFPAGGTWAYFYINFSSGGTLLNSYWGIVAGGTNIFNNAGTNCQGFAWRIR